MNYSSRTMKPEDWAEIKYFKSGDFNHPDKIGYEFMLWVDKLRKLLGLPLFPSSDYRDPGANVAAGGATNSAHMEIPCDAMDFSGRKMTGTTRFRLVQLAMEEGCTRIGVYENGSVHLDLSDNRPSPVLWTKV